MNSIDRRNFIATAGVLGLGLSVAPFDLHAETLPVTPTQTAGPFYPIPPISQQKFKDTDLTRKLGDDEVAKGELIVVEGKILDTNGQPIKNAVVEVWQAGTSGKYNHPRDDNQVPLDNNFQYWGTTLTDQNGSYSFKTIKPGEYPGRSPHIHYHVAAAGFRRMLTQMYFAQEGKANAKDFIYRNLSKKARDQVTVEFEKCKQLKDGTRGNFDVVLAKAR